MSFYLLPQIAVSVGILCFSGLQRRRGRGARERECTGRCHGGPMNRRATNCSTPPKTPAIPCTLSGLLRLQDLLRSRLRNVSSAGCVFQSLRLGLPVGRLLQPLHQPDHQSVPV